MNAQQLVAPVADDILRLADEAEAQRRLPDELMSRLMETGLFSIYTPQQFGGMGLPLPDALRVVEEVSRHDGSTGWTVALGFGNDVFTCGLPEESARAIFTNGSALLAGGPAFQGRAVAVDGGYRFTGQWPFASGAPTANWMNALAPIFDEDTPRAGPSGQPEMVTLFFHPTDIEIVDTWHVSGMRATGSHDLRAQDVFVPVERSAPFSLAGPVQPLRESTLARIPFLSALGAIQVPPTALGIATHAIAVFRDIAQAKERPFKPRLSDQVQTHVGIARAEALVRSARVYFYDAVQQIWAKASAAEEITLADRTNVRLAVLTVAENTTAAVDLVYRLAGANAITHPSVLERCWRDIHTATQHMQTQHGRWETAGRILFGLAPEDPFI